MDAEQENEFHEALARMRAAFADVPEEQLMQDVLDIIDQMREARRRETAAQTASASESAVQ